MLAEESRSALGFQDEQPAGTSLREWVLFCAVRVYVFGNTTRESNGRCHIMHGQLQGCNSESRRWRDRHRCQIQCLHLRGFPLVLSSFRYRPLWQARPTKHTRTPITRGSMDPSMATVNCHQAKYIPSPFIAVGFTLATPVYMLALPTLFQPPLIFNTKIPPKRSWAVATGQ